MYELANYEDPDQSKIIVELDLRGYSVVYPFSYCPNNGRECSIECYLTKKHGAIYEGYEPFEFYEFGFKFVYSSDWCNAPYSETMDREEASQFIPDGHRDTVIHIVQACFLALLREVRPPYVYRVSFTPSVPQKAQRKHALITVAAEAAGYHVVHEGTDSCDRRFWLMTPQPPSLTEN